MTDFAWMCPLDARQPESLVAEAVLAEGLGFEGVLAPDPFHPWTDEGAAGFLWTWLGAVSEATTRLWVMNAVTSPNTRYHPALIAQAAATVSRLSAGRFRLGLGLGDPLHYLPLGIRRERYAVQARSFTEAVSVIQRLLSGEVVTGGDEFPLDHARLFSPAASPIPLYVAAGGPRTATLAGAIADGLIVSVRDVRRSLDNVVRPFRNAAEGSGRSDPRVVATRWCILADSRAEAVSALGPFRGLRVPGRGTSPDPTVYRTTADSLDSDTLLADWAVVAGPDELVRLYRPLIEDLEADTVGICIASTNPEEAIRLVATDVLPRLRAVHPASAER